MRTRNWQEGAIGLVVPAVAIGIWQWVAMNGWVNEHVLPSPLEVARKWFAYLLPLNEFKDYTGGGWWSWAFSGELVVDSLGSMYRVVVGFLIGAVLALPLGLAMGASRVAYAWFNPLVQLLRPIPPIAYIPLSILWFGLGNP